ncbi:Sec-independent protein translocase TatB [Clavibacter sp. Sh2141]|jgi:sec-independent protein translocase protein TatB|uniref:Sec-independent protein translocase TatB n=1 Tax=unclassified Clavibacter TaxID=2626594 RepID=UPI00277EF5B3|nr:Sec-independent protein translocase TatB [Clavibacter sp. B3I6]MDQ0743623.1 sec-independent protein translocase protein TatB [Clavibacter sp. B3I6]
MFGLTFEKLMLIGIIAVFLLGPERLPIYTQKLADLVKAARRMATGARERMRDELGPEFDEVDWKKLDPRQYDPRRIIKEALFEDEPVVTKPRVPVETTVARRQRLEREAAAASAQPAPFDAEAT